MQPFAIHRLWVELFPKREKEEEKGLGVPKASRARSA